MDIWKVKAKQGEKVIVRYSKKEGDLLTLESYEEPLPALRQALQALAVDVVQICDLVPESVDHITVLGFTLTDSEDTTRAVITATQVLKSGATLCINTPCLPFDSDHGPRLSGPTQSRIDAACHAAAEYVNGERAQGELPLDEASASASDINKPIEDFIEGLAADGVEVTVQRNVRVAI